MSPTVNQAMLIVEIACVVNKKKLMAALANRKSDAVMLVNQAYRAGISRLMIKEPKGNSKAARNSIADVSRYSKLVFF